MLTLKKVKELVEAPSHAKRIPSPKMLFEEGIVLLRREFDQGSHLTVYNSGYVLFSAGKRNTVFHIHDCCGDYAYTEAIRRTGQARPSQRTVVCGKEHTSGYHCKG